VQVLVPEVSLAYVYRVKPAELTSIVLPRVALFAATTVAPALAVGLVAAVVAFGVAVFAVEEGVVEEACAVDVAPWVGDGVVVELLLPPQAALIAKTRNMAVAARNTGKRLLIGLLSGVGL
jgi:hypothetical protein